MNAEKMRDSPCCSSRFHLSVFILIALRSQFSNLVKKGGSRPSGAIHISFTTYFGAENPFEALLAAQTLAYITGA